MGDQIGTALGGMLSFVPYAEFERVRNLTVTPVEKTALFANLCRIDVLYMIARAGSGHIGSSFSSMDIMSWLLLNEVRMPRQGGENEGGDIFFSSKGHDAPALYTALIGLGRLDFDLIHRLRCLDGLPGHPDVSIPNIVTNTGSLGMGVSKAKGMIRARRLSHRTGYVYVLTGDGELQEGQFWESLISAANDSMEELVLIIDHNKLQSDTLVSRVSDLGDLGAKLVAFGWHVVRCNGNDIAEFSAALAEVKMVSGKPKAIIADTVKGKGVSCMEHTSIDSDVEYYKFHSGAPSADIYQQALQELLGVVNVKLAEEVVAPLCLESVERPQAVVPKNTQRLIPAYSAALIDQARRNSGIVALDADLILDTGLIPFQHEFPDRFVECGIAEQDMVSQAGGMALEGLLPVVHSFACFLSARPNEQVYNNATERKKIIYVGSLAGVLPGGPGHSHQAVRDISALGAIPGLTLMEPSCEAEVSMLLDWAVNSNPGSSYLRLISIPWECNFILPEGYRPEPGKGVALTGGNDAVIFAYGPVLLANAVEASSVIRQHYGLTVKVVNLPWLNRIDLEWLAGEVSGAPLVVSLDNHYLTGGQGEHLAAALKVCAPSVSHHRLGIEDIPLCGRNDEVLDHHGLSAKALVEFLAGALRATQKSL